MYSNHHYLPLYKMSKLHLGDSSTTSRTWVYWSADTFLASVSCHYLLWIQSTCIHNYTLYIYTYALEEQVYEAPQLTLHMNMSDALRLLADIKE